MSKVTAGIGATVAALTVIFGVSSCYNAQQHDRKVQSAFRAKIFENNRQPQELISVVVDGVKREGPLNKGAAFAGGQSSPTTAFIVAADPQAECWYSTLRVTEGSEKLPAWERLFGGELQEQYFMNSAFSSHSRLPLPTSQLAAKP